MTLFPLGRASAMGVAILLLAGCGGSSQPTATIPEGPSARETAQQGKYGDLMYLSGLAGKSYILSYPDGKLTALLRRQMAHVPTVLGMFFCPDLAGFRNTRTEQRSPQSRYPCRMMEMVAR